ncbi:MAG: DUF3828 domain-containing protein [Granulicella sp.]
MRWNLRAVGLILLVSALGHVCWAQRSAPSSPDVVTRSFYGWYLQQIAADHHPLTDKDPRLRKYVSAALLREIRRQMASPDGLDADYFIKAQDYRNEWLGKITTSETHVRGGIATTTVTLGDTLESRHRLTVRLVREAGVWKIRKVQRAN